jgi:hypothetical protein
MTNAAIATGPASIVLAVLALAGGCRAVERDADDAAAGSAADLPSTVAVADAHPSFLHGRITTVDGAAYEGRLRFGGNQEAFWGDYFNGTRKGNPWADQVPEDAFEARNGIEVLGLRIGWGRRADLDRQFMARFGDISRIVVRGGDLWVTLRSGTVVDLARYAADDFADGVRVWDPSHGVVDLDEGEMRAIDFMPPSEPGTDAPHRLHGKVRTSQGDFTGFLELDRTGNIGTDELEGYADGELVSLPFGTVASIERALLDSSRVSLLDGSDIVLSGTRSVGEDNAGIYVDDMRYGRVLIPWSAFERVDFSAVGGAGDSGPSYEDYPTGRPLVGVITTRTGHSLVGRLVYDLDESETIETLDAPSGGVNYTIPFGLVASIALPGGDDEAGGLATVVLQSGEELRLERTGDLGDGNAGLLVFIDGVERPEYVPWAEVERIDFDRPPAMYPPLAGLR